MCYNNIIVNERNGEVFFYGMLLFFRLSISIVVVFLLITIIMHVSVKKINKQNIIDTIRNDNI